MLVRVCDRCKENMEDLESSNCVLTCRGVSKDLCLKCWGLVKQFIEEMTSPKWEPTSLKEAFRPVQFYPDPLRGASTNSIPEVLRKK